MTDALKRLGYTFTHLIDAATALATFELNPVSEDVADKAHVAYDVATYVGPTLLELDASSGVDDYHVAAFLSRIVFLRRGTLESTSSPAL